MSDQPEQLFDDVTEEVVNSEVVLEPRENDLDYRDVMSDNYLLYAYSVLTDRAIPDVRDGLLPVQRRVIISMKDRNLHSAARYAKSAKIVGEVMGNYHPHGDSSIYGALARMAQSFSLRLPLIDGHGAFGSIDGDNPAAMRYTEARMSAAAERLVTDMHQQILVNDYGRNFDESKAEPKVLPAEFPNLLINGAVGIAVGMSSTFLPHNPGEAIDLCIWRLKNPNATDKAIAKRLPGPDFPTGAVVIDDAGLRQAYETGEGKVTAMAVTHTEPMAGGREKIVITELPYMVKKGGDNGIIAKINTKYLESKYPEFADMQDYSDDSGMRIEIQLKRGSNTASVLNRLRKDTDLRVTYGVQMNALVGGTPVTVNLGVIIDEFLAFRREIVVNRATKRIAEIEQRLHKLDAYLKALSAIDAVIDLMKKAADQDKARSGLMKLLKIDEQQAQWVLDLAIKRITKLDTFEIKDEAKKLREELKHLQKLIKTPDMITEVIEGELREIKKLIGTPRRTTIISSNDVDTVQAEEFSSVQPSEQATLLVSRNGLALCGGGTLSRGASLITDNNDKIVVADENANTAEDRIVFSGSGKVFRLRLAELPLDNRRSKGVKLSTLIGIDSSDTVAGVFPVPAEDATGSALFVYRSGTVKRTAWSEFSGAHNSGIVAAKPAEGDEVIAVIDCPDDSDILLTGSNAKTIRFKALGIRNMGRTSNGVRGFKLGPEECVIAGAVIPAGTSGSFAVLTTTGFAKRIPESDIPTKGRGGGGVAMMKNGGKYGDIQDAVFVQDGEEIVYHEDKGKLKSAAASSIAEVNRATVPKNWPGADSIGFLHTRVKRRA